MPNRLNVSQSDDIVEVNAQGDVDIEDILKSIDKIAGMPTSDGAHHILVDTRQLHSMPDTVSIYNLFTNFPKSFRVAVLSQQSQPTYRDILFAETVGRNRGVSIRLFNERDEALSWLMHTHRN